MNYSVKSTIKQNIVTDEIGLRCRSRRKDVHTHRSKHIDEPDNIQTLLQQQRIKEKRLLKQWKAARAAEKKTQLIMRRQSRDVRRGEKERFNENDETEYDTCGQVIDRVVWKHVGCTKECEINDCKQWQLDYLNSYETYYMV